MSPKKIEDLSEKDRSVSLDKFRFAKFLRYLKEYNATIKVKQPGSDKSQVYHGKKELGGSSIENLVTELLGLDDDYAREMCTRKFKLTDTHSNKERIRGLGDTLYAISIHKIHQDAEEQAPIPIRDINYQYYNRKSLSKGPKYDLDKDGLVTHDQRNKNAEFVLDHKFKKILRNYVTASIHGFIDDKDIINQLAGVNFVGFPLVEKQTNQLKVFLDSQKNAKTALKKIKEELSELSTSYNLVLDRHDVENSLLPYYRDFTILSSEESLKNSISLNYEGDLDAIIDDSKEFSPEDLIYFRYELIYEMITQEEDVEKWPDRFKALLMFCNFELEGVHAVFRELVIDEMKTIRYSYYTKNSYNNTRVHKANQSVRDITNVLLEYHISDPLDETLVLRDNHILPSPLFKHADKNAVSDQYKKSEIQLKLNQITENLIKQKLYSGLNMSEKLLPINKESAVLL